MVDGPKYALKKVIAILEIWANYLKLSLKLSLSKFGQQLLETAQQMFASTKRYVGEGKEVD